MRRIQVLPMGPGEPFICFFAKSQTVHAKPEYMVRVTDLDIGTQDALKLATEDWRKFSASS